MRVSFSAYGWRGDVEPVVRLAVRLRAPGTRVRGWGPPDCGAAEGGGALVATGVVPAGGWR